MKNNKHKELIFKKSVYDDLMILESVAFLFTVHGKLMKIHMKNHERRILAPEKGKQESRPARFSARKMISITIQH